MVTAESARRFGEHDLALAGDLAMRAATAVENARLYEERSAIARTLQASLLPPALPDVDGVDCAAVFQAAGEAYEVGGDFYDLFDTAQDEWFAVIGDVCGKGAEAAATTALVRYTVRAAAVRRRSPTQILHWLNEVMLRQAPHAMRFATVAVVRLDLREGAVQLTAATGGHPLPKIVRADGTVDTLGEPGTLMGVIPDVELFEATATLEPGDTLVLYTDGLTEAHAPGRLWSSEEVDAALEQAHAGAGSSVTRLVEQLARAALGDLARNPRDDIAIVGVRKR
jgi:serine phosphatase RsbU (regulator of sigma subunit)